MKKLVMFVGPPASGKSTRAKAKMVQHFHENFQYVNQDSQGKDAHVQLFRQAIADGRSIIVDRMNFNKEQRNRYLTLAREAGYDIEIHVLHVPYAVCLERALKREGHETIKDEKNALQAINFFFKTYERVEDGEADRVIRHWPEGDKPIAVVCDLDGTLCDVEHRRHHVRPEPGSGKKKNWMAFMDGIKDDGLNQWCADILESFSREHMIVYCSGRGREQEVATRDWLNYHDVLRFENAYGQKYDAELFMRMAGDSRRDDIVKEIILDFEILTRYTPYFMIDDRQQVVDMWRRRGFTCLQCAKGDF